MRIKTNLVVPSPAPAPLSPLETQLKLARAQNAYLHRQLALALAQGPLAPTDISPDASTQLALETLREQHAILKLHYHDAQQRIRWLEQDVAFAHRILGWKTAEAAQTTLDPTTQHVQDLLTSLLLLTHPDKWSQGQPATELAHELTVAITALREDVQNRRAGPML